MTEASGSCATFVKSNVGICSPNFAPQNKRVDILEDLKEAQKTYKADKMAQEYERILNKPKEERTFSEKMFLAQMKAAEVIDKFEPVLKPQIKYSA